MNAKDILARKFEKGFNGYKIDEVDDFVKEMSEEINNLQKDNRDLEKKLEVLADKIREYRNDEDALKEALLGAQKQGQQAISDAKEKAKKIVEDAETQAEVIKKASEELKNLRRDEGDKIKADAEAEGKMIVEEANKKAEKISNEMNLQLEMNREILTRLKNEVAEYNEKLINSYREQITRLEKIPSECENEYISRTYDEHSKNKAAQAKVINVNSADIIKSVKENDKDDFDSEEVFDVSDDEQNLLQNEGDGEQGYEVNELSFTKVFEEDSVSNDEEDFEEKKDSKVSNVNNNVFFKKSGGNLKKSGSLDFGMKNSLNNKN